MIGEIRTPWEHLGRAPPQLGRVGTGVREDLAEEAVSPGM